MDETLIGAGLRLRDITPADVPLLEALQAREAGGFNDFDGARPAIPDENWADGRMRTELRGAFLIERLEDGVVVGSIGYRRVVHYGPPPESNAWMLGIELLPEARGRGHGTEAQRLLARWLFRTTGVNRVEASTDIDNAAEARSLEKAGFTREGVIRGAQFRAGAYHDLVLYGKLRSDPR